jgi:ABC-type multidrug transport system permease subunit
MGLNGSSLGLFLGSVILDAKSISAVVPIVLLPVTLFSGFFKNRDDLPVWLGWFEYISPNKYAFTAYANNEVAYKDSLIDTLKFDIGKWEAVGILFALGIFFRLSSVFFLWLLKKRMQ